MIVPVTVDRIDERLRQLPPEKLGAVYDFVSSLLDREQSDHLSDAEMDARSTMLASEAVLRREWDSPGEDAAWAHL